MQRLAIFGGTFDPPHLGHLLIARSAQLQWSLDQVLWVPAYAPRYRAGAMPSGYGDRVKMVQLSLQQAATDLTPFTRTPAPSAAPPPLNFQLSTIESQLPQPCYAIDTLTALRSQIPAREWFWIIGLDAFQRLPSWYRRADLIPECFWLVAPRQEGFAAPLSQVSSSPRAFPPVPDPRPRWQEIGNQVCEQLNRQQIPLRWQFLDLPLLPLSSSEIRDRHRRGESVRHLVSASVFEYLEERSLYPPHAQDGEP